jgi:hypothetical protein
MSQESVIENQILEWLAMSRIGFFWKNVSGGFFDGKRMRKHTSQFAINGTSDILGIVNGRFIALEVKTDAGRPSAEQLAFIRRVTACGGLACVVRSVDQTRSAFVEWGLISSESFSAPSTSK